MLVHHRRAEPWRVTLVDTGEETMTGGRLRRVREYLDENEPFCFTYGDGVGNVDIRRLIEFHKEQGRLATLTAVRPPGRFGAITLKAGQNAVTRFREKPNGDGAWVNGGFFVLQPAAIDYIAGDLTVWENEPMERLASEGQLSAYRHDGFWQPMDTLRDKKLLEQLWAGGKAPWKVWQDEPISSEGPGIVNAIGSGTGVVALSGRAAASDSESKEIGARQAKAFPARPRRRA
jgi:glucose-1-phosphate cytidylyltransferase